MEVKPIQSGGVDGLSGVGGHPAGRSFPVSVAEWSEKLAQLHKNQIPIV
ncbi:hypothetical protein VQ335_005144 [Salmonella enterica]|nr:hypothetical protein [Salmonella enterica subsp. enterica serovar Abaetetuba]EJI6589344.1 hypothetical protein [Salmonella enterica]EMD4715298.1 hypothetical protein [Salmonella enterica]